jgi:polyferredoxin
MPPSRHRTPSLRRLRLARCRIRRLLLRIERRLTLSTGWVWVAAISFVGIEMFDVVFGAMLLAPEFLPVVLLGLALVWWFRESLRGAVRTLRDRIRR